MSDYGRYGDSDYRERDYDLRDEDRDLERGRRDMFGRRDWEDRGGRRAREIFFRDDRGFRGERRGRFERDYDNDDRDRGLPIDETSRLIASNKVEGTAVYGREGDRLGSIYNFMVDKFSGQVEYAVMTYGGFLGMGTRYYPLPWRILTYDTRQGGYRIDMSSRDFERAPSFGRDDEPRFNREYGRRVNRWYGLDR